MPRSVVRPPTIYKVAELPPSERDRECECWSGHPEPSPCDQEAGYVFVYAASQREDDERRRNLLACEDCVPQVNDRDLSADGGAEQVQADSQTTHLRFAHRNVGLVLDGEEDATVRYDLERDLEAGDTVELLTPNGAVFALAEVEDVYTCELRHAHFDMTAADGRAHPSTSTSDLQGRLNRHYPEVPEVGLEDEVTVIYFDVQQLGGEAGE